MDEMFAFGILRNYDIGSDSRISYVEQSTYKICVHLLHAPLVIHKTVDINTKKSNKYYNRYDSTYMLARTSIG